MRSSNSNNPFDSNNSNPFDSNTTGNPFESNNPFDDDGDYEEHENENEHEYDNNRNNNNTIADDLISNDNNDNRNEKEEDDDDNNTPSCNSSNSSTDEYYDGESSWQYLGELPYRRVNIYNNIEWDNSQQQKQEEKEQSTGLAYYPNNWYTINNKDTNKNSNNNKGFLLQSREDIHKLLISTTKTKVAGCPYGGPIASITIPIISTGTNLNMMTSELRIMTCHGKLLCSKPFPPPFLESSSTNGKYHNAASDVFSIGFTDRGLCVVIMRDSLCFTYNIKGESVLPPFYISPHHNNQNNVTTASSSTSSSTVELVHACVFSSGVAVLSESMSVTLVEFLEEEEDDPIYVDEAYLAARKIVATVGVGGVATVVKGVSLGSARCLSSSGHYALVTPLPTAAHANAHGYGYCAIAVLPKQHTESRHPEIFLSTSDHSVVIVDSSTAEFTDVNCRARISGPIISMCFAPNGRFLACFTSNSILTVISTSFETKVLDFDTSEGSSAPPRDMKWCGEDSVVLHWKNLGVLMVGPYGDWLRFPYQNTANLHIISEIDCCRIVTDSSVDILQRVPPATASLLRIGSIEPAALLLDASDSFSSGSPASDEAARAITKTGLLTTAIETCADAATKECDISTQKRLLHAASYGMHFTYKELSDERIYMGGDAYADPSTVPTDVRPSPTALTFVATAKKIRVLNALRTIGFPITSSQYDAVTPNGIIGRLIAMRRPALACTLAGYLSLHPSIQAMARASRASACVVSTTADTTTNHTQSYTDVQIMELVNAILNETPDNKSYDNTLSTPSYYYNWGAYASVAFTAFQNGRSGVASLLLRLEHCIKDKCSVLIYMGLFADAASVASTAKDLDLLFLSIVEYEKSCYNNNSSTSKQQQQQQQQFLLTIVTKFPSDAIYLLKLYYSTLLQDNSNKPVINLLLKAQLFMDAGCFLLQRAMLGVHNHNQRRGIITASSSHKNGLDNERISFMKEASRIFGLSKECAFQKTCTDDYLELISEQERLRANFNSQTISPYSSSITSTLSSIIQYAAQSPTESNKIFLEADKFSKKFRLTDKRAWHIKVQALSKSQQWAQLRILADSRAKPPIGFKPFALATIRYNQPKVEITRYIERITSNDDRYELFVEAKLWKRALDEALKLRDGSRIQYVRSACGNMEIIALCDDLIRRIQ